MPDSIPDYHVAYLSLDHAQDALLQIRAISEHLSASSTRPRLPDTPLTPQAIAALSAEVMQSVNSLTMAMSTFGHNINNAIEDQVVRLVSIEGKAMHTDRVLPLLSQSVARQRVGRVCAPKPPLPPLRGRVVAPATPAKPPRAYSRRKVDYSGLDEVGHWKKKDDVEEYRPLTSNRQMEVYFNTLKLRKTRLVVSS